MTKKKLTLVEIVLYLCALVLLFVEHMFKFVVSWLYKGSDSWIDKYIYHYSLKTASQRFAFESFDYTVQIVFVLMICFLIVNLFLKKPMLEKKMLFPLTLVPLVSFIIFSFKILSYDVENIRSNSEPLLDKTLFRVYAEPLFYVELAVLLLAVIISAIKYFLPLPNTSILSQSQQNIKKEPTDDLKKYKELLDSGVITQEEFDAKKKQLLGL